MKIPSRLAVALTTAITGLMALSAEVNMSHPAHVGCLIAGGLILGLIVHPGESGTVAAAAGPPYVIPATPPVPAPVAAPVPAPVAVAVAAPADRTLP